VGKQYWRIGVKYVDLKLFELGYPYVWGDSVTEWGYLDYLKDIQIGDVIVAGGIEKVSFVGEVSAKPAFLFPSEDNAVALFDGYGIREASGTADKKVIDAFLPHENDINDAVCIPVTWFPIDCTSLRMPAQDRGGIKPLNASGIAYISQIISGEKPEPVKSFPRSDSLLDFTAMDFETGSGYRNSVCQVGLVKAVNGIIVETYSSLIKPPNNFIRDDFTDIHGISPDDTKYAPSFAESYPRWKHLVENQTLVAHNMKFDYSCLTACLADFCNLNVSFKTYCTMKIWRGAFENAQLSTCCKENGIELLRHHNALADAEACARLFIIAVNTGRDLKD
jgi:DNA polymerase-3 subunit epsilon